VTTEPADAAAEVLAIEDALLAAWGGPVPAEVADHVADGFGFWSLSGERWDREAFLRIMAAAPRDGETRVEGAEVRVVGDTAVYTARVTDVLVEADGTREVRTCVTDVFAFHAGRWQLVASHESVLDPLG
jgi:ketosteroid isomerase-like protein